jgi:WD repeat-containing protein 92
VLALEPKIPEGEIKPDCWTVAFGNSYNDQERCIAAGYDNGDLKLFDLKGNSLRWDANLMNGVCHVEFDRKDIKMNKLVATTLEGTTQVFDMRTQHVETGFACLKQKNPKNTSTLWGAKHLPQNRDVFVTLGGDGNLSIYQYKYPQQRVIKDADGRDKGVVGSLELLNDRVMSTQPVCSFDWHPEKLGLAVMACLDQTCKVAIVTKLNLY